MSINENWNIRSRSHVCAQTGEAFADGENFYTALFEDPQTDELVRRDYSLKSWGTVRSEVKPFSFWKSTYEAPRHDAKPEVVEKEGAEGLLRRLIEEDAAGTENTRYILAVMLERKKILKHTATRETEDANFLVYEHPKSGEVYIIRDPELRLDQVEFVQREVSLLLSHGQYAQHKPDQPAPVPPEEPPPPADAESAAVDASVIAPDGEASDPVEALDEGGAGIDPDESNASPEAGIAEDSPEDIAADEQETEMEIVVVDEEPAEENPANAAREDSEDSSPGEAESDSENTVVDETFVEETTVPAGQDEALSEQNSRGD